MTIKTEYTNFKDCADEAPAGSYNLAKDICSSIGSSVDDLIHAVRHLGLKADNSDGAYALECAIYAWIKEANPDESIFPAAEGFGKSMSGPARERVLANTVRDTEFLAQIRVV